MDQEAVTEVPTSLKKLVRIVARSFYGIEHFLLMDMLIRNPCMKEDDLLQVLNFDKRMLRVVVTALKSEHFLKARIKMETDMEGKATKHNYYFINYTGFVNVVKYKLFHMQQKLAAQERDSTSRTSFKCTACEKGFTDLDADRLYDPMTGVFRCTLCDGELEPEQSEAPVQDAKALIAKFNEQFEPLYELVKLCEDFKLSTEILEPEPSDITHLKDDRKYMPKSKGDANDKWSGDATKGRGFGATESTVSVSVGAEATNNLNIKPEKVERPVWMTESTIDGTQHYQPPAVPTHAASVYQPTPGGSTAAVNSAIMQTLLIHEKKGPQNTHAPSSSQQTSMAAAAIANVHSSSDSSDMDDDDPTTPFSKPVKDYQNVMVEDMDDDDEEEDLTMTVNGRKVAYHDITPDIVSSMTREEKDSYIQLGKEIFENMG